MHEKKETTYLSLFVELTDERRLELSSELSGIIVDIDELLEQKRESMSIYKDREKALRAKLSEISTDIKEGKTLETVRCAKVYDYSQGTMTVYRGDTGEIVEQRELDNHEKQVRMDLDNHDNVTTLPIYDAPIEEAGVDAPPVSFNKKNKSQPRHLNPGITRESDVDLSDYRNA